MCHSLTPLLNTGDHCVVLLTTLFLRMKKVNCDATYRSASTHELHTDSIYSTKKILNLSSSLGACPDPVYDNQLRSRKRKKPLFEWRWAGQPVQDGSPSPSELRYRSHAIESIIPPNLKFFVMISRVRGMPHLAALMHSYCLGVPRFLICAAS